MSEHSKLLNIKCRGLKTQSLVDQLSSASFSPAIKHVLDLILATPHFVIEVGYPIGAIDDDGTPLDGREPSDGFKRVFAAALNADIEALIGEHERLSRIKREVEDRVKGRGCIKFQPTNNKQKERQKQPRTLQDKVRAAATVATYGVEKSGYPTLLTLMWPLEEFALYEASSEAASLLGDVLTALLRDMPRHQSELILKAQADRLI